MDQGELPEHDSSRSCSGDQLAPEVLGTALSVERLMVPPDARGTCPRTRGTPWVACGHPQRQEVRIVARCCATGHGARPADARSRRRDLGAHRAEPGAGTGRRRSPPRWLTDGVPALSSADLRSGPRTAARASGPTRRGSPRTRRSPRLRRLASPGRRKTVAPAARADHLLGDAADRTDAAGVVDRAGPGDVRAVGERARCELVDDAEREHQARRWARRRPRARSRR